jgi:hypothetical protein
LKVRKRNYVSFTKNGNAGERQYVFAKPGRHHFQRESDGIIQDVRDRYHEEKERKRENVNPESIPPEKDPEESSYHQHQ